MAMPTNNVHAACTTAAQPVDKAREPHHMRKLAFPHALLHMTIGGKQTLVLRPFSCSEIMPSAEPIIHIHGIAVIL